MRGDNDPGDITKGDHSAPPIIKFLLTDGDAQLPVRATEDASGIDLFSPLQLKTDVYWTQISKLNCQKDD